MSYTPKKGGRPKLPHMERRCRNITIALTESEYSKVIEYADISGKMPSIILREMAFEGTAKLVPKVNKETRAELGKAGGLVKVLIEQARAKQIVMTPDREAYLVRLVEFIKKVRAEVIGDDK